MSSSLEKTTAVLATPTRVVVVRQRAVEAYDTSGASVAKATLARDATAAATDGLYIAVADKAKLVVFDLQLRLLGEIPLVELCASVVIVSQHRLICGPDYDWQRKFYSYDLAQRKYIGPSAKSWTYNGVPMKRVPGKDYFVTVTVDTSPSDFHLYEVTSAGLANYVCESPYHGGFVATPEFAFDKDAVHLINVDGLMMRIVGTECANVFKSDYFLKNGNLGTLTSTERFAALASDAQGLLGGLVTPEKTWPGDCEKGCSVQKVDISGRQVLTACRVRRKTERFNGAVLSPDRKALVVGYRTGATYKVEAFLFAP